MLLFKLTLLFPLLLRSESRQSFLPNIQAPEQRVQNNSQSVATLNRRYKSRFHTLTRRIVVAVCNSKGTMGEIRLIHRIHTPLPRARSSFPTGIREPVGISFCDS
ncbi:hypothetical protein IW262DRAFT_1398907 [Armillaria fumosa]|nr:hypothetical protein IW262DRAFT_1398907 [Armillaria fumosa]